LQPVRSRSLSRPPKSCRTPLMGFVAGFAPPSTSNACVHSQLATVPVQAGCPADWTCDGLGLAPSSTAAVSLRAFGPGLPHRDSFRPCRFSRLRRLAPHTRCRSVAPCSRPWGSPGCRHQRGPDPPRRSSPPRPCGLGVRSDGARRGSHGLVDRCVRRRRPTKLCTEAHRDDGPGDRAALHCWSDGNKSAATASGRGWSMTSLGPRSVRGRQAACRRDPRPSRLPCPSLASAGCPPFARCLAEA